MFRDNVISHYEEWLVLLCFVLSFIQDNYTVQGSHDNNRGSINAQDPLLAPGSTVGTGGKKRGPRPKKLTKEEKRQKRMDANDRERERMGKLNTAFNSLRHLLPKHGNDRELSKFETVQIAKNYIRALNQMLAEAERAEEEGDGGGGGGASYGSNPHQGYHHIHGELSGESGEMSSYHYM